MKQYKDNFLKPLMPNTTENNAMTEKELLEICIEIVKHTNYTPSYGYIHGPFATTIPNEQPRNTTDTSTIRAAAINIITKKLSNYIPEVPKRATV